MLDTDVLVFGAHPDDIEFGMAGTLVKFVEQGYKVVFIVLTRGEMGSRGTAEQREEEAKKAARIIGADIEFLDFKDTQVFDNHENRLQIAELIRKYKPKIVFAPYHTLKGSYLDGKSHPDHAACGELVRNALRLAKFKKIKLKYDEHLVQKLIYYFFPKGKENLIVDISSQINKALQAIKAHESQFEGNELLEMLTLWRKFLGMGIKVKYAEGFFTDDLIRMNAKRFFEI